MQEGFGGIKIIKLLGREKFFFNKFKFHNFNLAKMTPPWGPVGGGGGPQGV